MCRILPQLPLEIIVEILSRLPVKPLLRFKCICKSWFSLISNNPEFAKIHLRYANQDTDINRHRLLLSTYPFQSMDHDAYCNGDHHVVTRELTYPTAAAESAEVLEFIGSCDGLIATALNSDHSHIIVWNPTTGDSKELPISDNSSISGEITFSGFGYDSDLDDYKVVRGAAFTTGSEIKMEVFNLKANTWRSIKDLHSNNSLNSSSICINGFLHWLVTVENDANRKLGIVSFDLAEEKFVETVAVPENVSKNMGSDSRIQRVGEKLCVCTHWYAECYEGWIMKRDGREIWWSKLYSFSSDPLPACKYWIEEIWVAKNGKILLDLDGRELVVYNPEEQSLLEYGVEWDGFEAITYMETLVSPNVA